ncbi:MAG: hypothetical protein KAX78_00725, partial [Phycisphaerae bacterium]|nr:hypothetical protein [Phycisphaerae bacterium]
GVVLSGGGAEPADDCFRNLPPGCYITKSFVLSRGQTVGIARKLGAGIKEVFNTYLNVQGKPIQVNILVAEADADAAKLYTAISGMKAHPAFCLRQGKRVIEYVGNDPSLATKVSYELGFLPKPKQILYRIVAHVATVDKADYMSFNKLFNLFLTTNRAAPTKEALSQIGTLSKRFQFGSSITMRTPALGRATSTHSFSPVPRKSQKAEHGETITYSFDKPPKVLGVPYVAVTLGITTDSTGVTPTTRKSDNALLVSTALWPVDDPDIAALAKRITSQKRTSQAKVQAILEWLTPGKNIKFGGPVSGSRWGVKKVLQQNHGHCWDFSDCFVTLCRASGIPCRQVGGWLYGTSGHIWSEVLVEGKGWQQVDATGGGKLECGIYHIPYFTTETGEMPILYVSMPKVEIVETKQ